MLGLTPSPPRPVVSALVGILALPAAAVATAVALSSPQSINEAGDRPFVLGMQVVAAEAPAVAARHGPGGAGQVALCAQWPDAAQEVPFCWPPSAVAAGAE